MLHGLVLPASRRGLDMHLARSVASIGWFGVCGLLLRAGLGEVAGDWSSYTEWMSAFVFTGVIKTSWGVCVSTIFSMKSGMYIRALGCGGQNSYQSPESISHRRPMGGSIVDSWSILRSGSERRAGACARQA